MNKVSLVGAGPGDYGLMTLKGAERLRRAETVIYDRLINPRLLHLCPEGCEKIYVGKESGSHALPQEQINELLLKKAREGRRVVRLKGGDPYVFGRGGEEARYLAEHGQDFEVIPGVTSAVAGPAYAGIPVTHRGTASSFHVFTGHASENGSLDWKTAAALPGTLIFLMGLANLGEISARLTEWGKDPATPAALISRAAMPEQKTLVSTLGEIASLSAGVPSPALLVLGDTVALRETLAFYEKKKLLGRSVVLTRDAEQSEGLASLLEEEGARALFFPALTCRDCPDPALDEALRHMGGFTHAVFTSRNAVRIFFRRTEELGLDSRILAGIRVCAVGSSTGALLREHGVRPDLIPALFTSEGLWELLQKELTPESRVLMPRALVSRGELARRIASVCPLEAPVLYETACGPGDPETGARILEGSADWIVFASPSAVSNTLQLLGEGGKEAVGRMKIAAIGPVTGRFLEKSGLPPRCVSETPGDEAMLQAILDSEE